MLLIRYELKKLFLKRTIIIAVIVFSIINLVHINTIYKEKSLLAEVGNSTWSPIYWELYPQFSGDITNGKINKLMNMFNPLEKMTADRTVSTAKDNPNTFTGSVYWDYYLLRDLFVKPMEYMYTYKNISRDIVEKSNDNLKFYSDLGNDYECRKNAKINKLFNDRSITEFAYTESYTHYIAYDFSVLLVLLICIYGIVNVFVREKESQMDMLLLTNISGGKKTVTAKIVAVSIFILVISLWFSLIDFTGFSIAFGTTQGSSLPIFALKDFITCPLNVSLWQYALIAAAIKALGFWVLGMIFLLISLFGKNALMPFIINLSLSCGFIGIWSNFNSSENMFIKTINPFSLVCNNLLFAKTEFLNCFGFPVLSLVATIVFGIIIGVISVVLIYKFSKRNAFC